jgi:hypothetical protein
MRELVSVIDEAALHLGIWCHKGGSLFADREPQSREEICPATAQRAS